MGARAVITVLAAALLGGAGCLTPALGAEPGDDAVPAGTARQPLRQYLFDAAQPPHGAMDAGLAPSPVPARLRKLYRDMRNPVPDTPDVLAKGRLLYGANCQVCHAGEAAGEGLPGAPPGDLGAAAYQSSRTDGEIFYAIQNGVPGTAMLPWGGRLSDRDVWLLVRYIRHLAAP